GLAPVLRAILSLGSLSEHARPGPRSCPLGQEEIPEAAPTSTQSNTMDRPHLASRSGVVCPLADGGAARRHGGSCWSREAQVQFCESLGVRFPGATHLVLGFQYQTDAECFRDHLAERLKRFGLELHGSGRQGCKSRKVKDLLPSIA